MLNQCSHPVAHCEMNNHNRLPAKSLNVPQTFHPNCSSSPSRDSADCSESQSNSVALASSLPQVTDRPTRPLCQNPHYSNGFDCGSNHHPETGQPKHPVLHCSDYSAFFHRPITDSSQIVQYSPRDFDPSYMAQGFHQDV